MIIEPEGSHMLDIIRKYAMDGRVDVISMDKENRFWKLAKALAQGGAKGNARHEILTPHTLNRHPCLALDPGETTGLAVWDPSSEVILLAQIKTKTIAQGFDSIFGIINYLSLDGPSLDHVRYEDYRVYGNMTEQHAFSHLHTARMIGAIEVACHLALVPWSSCLAMHAKTFWTDDKLKMCGLYNRGMRHARDAERHLLRFMGERNSVRRSES